MAFNKCQEERDAIIRKQNGESLALEQKFRDQLAENGVANGLRELIAISYQPESKIADFVARGQDAISDAIFGENGTNQGGSRIVNTVLSQTSNAARQAFSNTANSLLQGITGGALDLNNLDDHADTLSETSKIVQESIEIAQRANTELNNISEYCGASPYVVDLLSRGIKQKHLFAVEFEVSTQYQDTLGQLDHSMMVKSCERPTVTFDYDDVNMYNYRTQVIKSAKYNPITVRFSEDGTSHVAMFYEFYLKAMSPIANTYTPQFFESDGFSGMDWNIDGTKVSSPMSGSIPGEVKTNSYGASIGPLLNDESSHVNNRQILQSMTIYHVYHHPYAQNQGSKNGTPVMDIYKLLNPRITEMNMDELSMEEAEKTETSFTISYDSFFMLASSAPLGLSKITGGKTLAAQYPLRPNERAFGFNPRYPTAEQNTGEEDGYFDRVRESLNLETLKNGILEPFGKTGVGKVVTGAYSKAKARLSTN